MRQYLTRIVTSFIFSGFLLSSFPVFGQAIVNRYANCPAGDMLLMYYGSKARCSWTESEVAPLVAHTFMDGHTDWFFPSFLYLEFKHEKNALGNDMGKNTSTKEDWEWLLSRFEANKEGLNALDNCIESLKRKLGPPPFKHKVVLVVPSPINNQQDWGKLNGKRMNFNKTSDKIKVVQWYIDELIRRFNKQQFQNIILDGFYWVEETSRTCAEVLPSVSSYIHQKGYKFYWIPFYTARGRFDWKRFGFDYAYLQTGYFWNRELGIERINEACESAKKYGMGLEFEISEKYFNNRSEYAHRMSNLIDAFEQNGVFSDCALTYYCGNKVLLDMCKSSRTDDRMILDRLASLVASRNHKLSLLHSPIQYNSVTTSPSSSSQPKNSTRDKSGLDWRDPEYWHF